VFREPATLREAALQILGTAEPTEKALLTRAAAMRWRNRTLPPGIAKLPPTRPARLDRPVLLPPRAMPKRRAGGAQASRIALLHALAHIELNAIDLVWDLIARFPPPAPRYDDEWVAVAEDEARHFDLVCARLAALGSHYGALPAHDGLWQAAETTAHDHLARLAIVPMVLEARGLDVTPAMIATLEAAGDAASAKVLDMIYREEVGHVRTGRFWFEQLCKTNNEPPAEKWRQLVKRYFRGGLKPPFNDAARLEAGLTEEYYKSFATDA
jgi:uncharacterized ferritin-like protein (DUF455 family)